MQVQMTVLQPHSSRVGFITNAHDQTTKTYYKHQDSRINKAQVLKTSVNSDIKDNSSETKLRGRLLESFQEDTKYEHTFAIEYQRYIERKNDHDSRYKNPKLKTDLQMEKEASTFYTRTVFFDVQDEIYASYSRCMSVNVVQVDNAEKYSIRYMQAKNRIRGNNNFVVYQVDFCKSKKEIECSCKHYEAYGLFCRHIFYVLRMNNIKEFPRKYLNKRWLKNDKPFNSAVRRIVGGSYSILESEVFDLYEIFESTIDRLVHDMDTLKIYKEQMKDLLNKAKIDVLTVPKLNSKNVFSAMLGVKEPTAKTIGNPDHSSNKGTGVHSRWKSKAEKEKEAAKNSKKRRTCSKCGNKEGHNSKTCTNERVQPSNKVKKTLQATPTRIGLRSRRN
ncbi:FAR1 DNA binding domain, zinc finger, SWIM-type, MULE transposase domain containing protein [Tanacetum coccineum]